MKIKGKIEAISYKDSNDRLCKKVKIINDHDNILKEILIPESTIKEFPDKRYILSFYGVGVIFENLNIDDYGDLQGDISYKVDYINI